MPFDFFSKPAAIVREEDNRVEVSPDFSSISTANHALSTHTKNTGAVPLQTSHNEWDGKKTLVLEKTGIGRLWNEVQYEVLPVSVINGEED